MKPIAGHRKDSVGAGFIPARALSGTEAQDVGEALWDFNSVILFVFTLGTLAHFRHFRHFRHFF